MFLVALWSPVRKELISWVSCMCCFLVFCHFLIQCPESGVILNCIDSWSVPSSLLWSLNTMLVQQDISNPVYYSDLYNVGKSSKDHQALKKSGI